jgi:hypothetical protein
MIKNRDKKNMYHGDVAHFALKKQTKEKENKHL